jgi:hypothetical protein
MRLSALIARCRDLGAEDPELNVDSIRWAKCVADGVVLGKEYSDHELASDLDDWAIQSFRSERSRLYTLRDILRAHKLT